MEDKVYSVSEAVQLTGVPSHVLRYWEEELQITIKRTSLGHRVYSEENLNLFRQVKAWKEKGIQLKAIRLLIRDDRQESNLAEEVREIERAEESWNRNGTVYEEEEDFSYEVVLRESPPDNLKQFEAILKKMIEDVLMEQNEKLEQALTCAVREEIEELFLRYMQLSMQEAAVSGIHKTGRKGILSWLKHLLNRE